MIANRVFITGGAGFIGSSAADHFLASGAEVVVYDNFSTGRRDFLTRGASAHPRFTLVEGDTADLAAMTAAMRGADLVLHFAANADVRFGTEHPRKDLEQNTIATFNVLEAMRASGVSRASASRPRDRSTARPRSSRRRKTRRSPCKRRSTARRSSPARG